MIKTLSPKRGVNPGWPGIFLVIVFVLLADVALSQDKNSEPEEKPVDDSLVFPVRLYQKYASGADGARCPMFPSCSTYSLNAFHKHGAIMGWIMTCDRLMRCGRDEVGHTRPVRVGQKFLGPDSLENNDFWWERPSDKVLK
jgi:putative component of membrane protein insertase Oxa1/YidC/SpoIIIJ protein YidD